MTKNSWEGTNARCRVGFLKQLAIKLNEDAGYTIFKQCWLHYKICRKQIRNFLSLTVSWRTIFIYTLYISEFLLFLPLFPWIPSFLLGRPRWRFLMNTCHILRIDEGNTCYIYEVNNSCKQCTKYEKSFPEMLLCLFKAVIWCHYIIAHFLIASLGKMGK